MTLQEDYGVPVDPRTTLILLVLVNIASFSQKSLFVECCLISALVLFMIACGCALQVFKLMIFLAAVIFLQYFVFPNAHQIFVTLFTILSVYIRKLIPCLMVGTVIIRRIPLRYLILGARKWRLPEPVIISLSVTLRYFPAIREEASRIRDAMKLRGVRWAERFESFMVPLIMSAANTAEELSAAAVTRGIENPVKKTSVIDIRFRLRDYGILAGGTVLAAAAMVV